MNSSLTCEYASLPPFVPPQLILSARRTIHSPISSTHPSLHHRALTQVNTSPHPTPTIIHYPAPLAPSDLIVRVHESAAVPNSSSASVAMAALMDVAVTGLTLSYGPGYSEWKKRWWRQMDGDRITHPWWLWPLTVCSISAHLLILKGFQCIKACSDQGMPMRP